MSKKQVIRAECVYCNTTGVYSGWAEGKNIGVVCTFCDGTGCQEIQYEPFKKRRDIKNVDVVLSPNQSSSVSYADFKQGKMP